MKLITHCTTSWSRLPLRGTSPGCTLAPPGGGAACPGTGPGGQEWREPAPRPGHTPTPPGFLPSLHLHPSHACHAGCHPAETFGSQGDKSEQTTVQAPELTAVKSEHPGLLAPSLRSLLSCVATLPEGRGLSGKAWPAGPGPTRGLEQGRALPHSKPAASCKPPATSSYLERPHPAPRSSSGTPSPHPPTPHGRRAPRQMCRVLPSPHLHSG